MSPISRLSLAIAATWSVSTDCEARKVSKFSQKGLANERSTQTTVSRVDALITDFPYHFEDRHCGPNTERYN